MGCRSNMITLLSGALPVGSCRLPLAGALCSSNQGASIVRLD